MAIKMTKEEYQAKYGVAPAVSTTPQPVTHKMTRAEYETRYGQSVDGEPLTNRYNGEQSFAKMKNGLGYKIADALTQGEQATGKILGQSLAVANPITGNLTKDFKAMEDSKQGLSDLQLSVIKEIKAKKLRGEDTSRLENVLNKTSTNTANQSIADIAPDTQKTNLQALGAVGQVGLDALSAGTYKPLATTAGLARTAEGAVAANKAYLALSTGQKLTKIGKDTLKLAGTVTPFGYGYDVAGNLQEGKTGKEAATPGSGTLFSTIIPLAIGGARAAKALSQPISEYVVGNLSGKGVPATQQLAKGGQDFMGITPSEVLSDTRNSLSLYDNSVKNQFGASKKELVDQFTGQRIGIEPTDTTKLRTIANEFGFGDRLPNNTANMSVKETMDLLSEINAKGRTKITVMDTPAIRQAKYDLSQLKSSIKAKAVKEFGGKEGTFDKVYSNYSKAQGVIDGMENIVGSISKYKTLSPTQINTAYSRLQRLFTQDSKAYIDAVKSFEAVTGERILDKVAASQFSEIVPKNLKAGDSNMYSVVNDVFSLLTFPLRSPKIGAKLVSFTSGYKPSVVTSLLNANPKIRQSIYDAVIKENKSLDEAIGNAVEQYGKIPNKQGGFIRIGGGENQSPIQSLKANQAQTTQELATKKTTASPKKATTPKNKVIIKDTIPQSTAKVNKVIDDHVAKNIDDLISEANKIKKNGQVDLEAIQQLEDIQKNVVSGSLTTEERRVYNEIAKSLNREDLIIKP